LNLKQIDVVNVFDMGNDKSVGGIDSNAYVMVWVNVVLKWINFRVIE
jgi:hypothetical protein